MTTPGSLSYAAPRDRVDTFARMYADLNRQVQEMRGTVTSAQVIIAGSGPSLTPEQFGDANTGNGVADDTAAFQAMAATAVAGQSCIGTAGKTYTLNSTVNWPNDYVTWDGRGASIQAGTARTDTNAAEDRLFSVVSGMGVQILNTRFLAGLTPAGSPTVGGKVYFGQSSYCIVDHCTFDGEGLPGWTVALYGCATTLISHCAVTRGAIGGISNQSCRFRDNGVDGSAIMALGGVGYTVAPSAYNIYEGNAVTNRLGYGIAEVCGDPGASFGHTFRDNRLFTPNAAGSAQVGIGAIGPDCVFTGNKIYDPVAAGIQASAYGSQVDDNTVAFSSGGHLPAVGIQLVA